MQYLIKCNFSFDVHTKSDRKNGICAHVLALQDVERFAEAIKMLFFQSFDVFMNSDEKISICAQCVGVVDFKLKADEKKIVH